MLLALRWAKSRAGHEDANIKVADSSFVPERRVQMGTRIFLSKAESVHYAPSRLCSKKGGPVRCYETEL